MQSYQNAGANEATKPHLLHHSYIQLNHLPNVVHKVPYWHRQPQSHGNRVHIYEIDPMFPNDLLVDDDYLSKHNRTDSYENRSIPVF